MSLTFAQTLADAPRIEKLKLWMRLQRPQLSFSTLAKPLDIAGNTLARNCYRETMPVYQHMYMVDAGVPAELLPLPEDKKSGPKPKVCAEPAQAV